MRAVVEAQPFPPFPPDVTDPHLEVHIAVPMVPTRVRRQTDPPGGSISISPATASNSGRNASSD
jgi:hypothetical protein